MEINQAKELLINLGASYFYDQYGEYSVDEIISQIKNDIHQNIKHIVFWEQSRDAILTVSKYFSSDEILSLLKDEFGLFPKVVGDGKIFLEVFSQELNEAIQEVKVQIVNKD